MEWKKPAFVPVEMNAEIGAYQGDFEDEVPDRLTAEEPLAEAVETSKDDG